MKGISLNIQIECDCGHLIEAENAVTAGMLLLREVKIKCSECGTGFYMHLQEVKKSLAKEFPAAL